MPDSFDERKRRRQTPLLWQVIAVSAAFDNHMSMLVGDVDGSFFQGSWPTCFQITTYRQQRGLFIRRHVTTAGIQLKNAQPGL